MKTLKQKREIAKNIDRVVKKWVKENYGEDLTIEDLDIIDLRLRLTEAMLK